MFEYCGNAVLFFIILGTIILGIFVPLYGLSIALTIMAVIFIPFIVFYYCICCNKSSKRAENTDSEGPESQLETRIQEIYSTTTPTGFENFTRTLSPETYQGHLSVSLPPEIILTPSSPHIISSESDRPPSYESLYHQWNKQWWPWFERQRLKSLILHGS